MGKASDRKSGRPSASTDIVKKSTVPEDDGHLLLSFRHAQPRFGIEQLNERQRSEFLLKWFKRCAFSWTELGTHTKHGLGYEMLPKSSFRPKIPDALTRTKYMVFRHDGNLPFAGFKAGDVFYVLWVEAKFNELYKH